MKINYRIFSLIALVLISLVIFNCKSKENKTNRLEDVEKKEPDSATLTVLDYNNLKAVKANLESPKFSSVYKKLLKDADEALNDSLFSVVFKTQTPPSGDKHDYISYGPYWWPDPEKTDGLPWIRKDGEINPLTRDNTTDYTAKSQFFSNTSDLSLAYFFSGNEVYAQKAIELLKVWFLDEQTKMNPNLDFAQGIPGINVGRGIGIIDFAGITKIITAIEILEIENAIDSEMRDDLRQWFSDYLNWLQTSENGIFEDNTKNNHGTWYDVQLVSIQLFLNKKEEAKNVLETAKSKRLTSQIEPNGAQPHELARTKTLSYSTMNLRGMTQLAHLGTKVNVDLWNFSPANQGSIKQAYEFLKPYAKGEKDWEYKQINSKEKAVQGLKQLFLNTGCQFDIPEYREIGSHGNKEAKSLLYNCY